jgi:hypothetical protein
MELLKLKKHAEFKAECKRLGLLTSGRKIDLHDCIQAHFCFTGDPQANIEEIGYAFLANYESRSEARQAVEAEWRKWRNRQLKTCFKEWFKCKSLGCPIQLFIAGNPNQCDLKVGCNEECQ